MTYVQCMTVPHSHIDIHSQQRKDQRISLRIRPDDDNLIRQAAAAADQSLSEFMIDSARIRSEQLLANRTKFTLDERSWRRFVAELDRPARKIEPLAGLLSGEYHRGRRGR